jgi:hypothetical protein
VLGPAPDVSSGKPEMACADAWTRCFCR